jgi:hypothetical protein
VLKLLEFPRRTVLVKFRVEISEWMTGYETQPQSLLSVLSLLVHTSIMYSQSSVSVLCPLRALRTRSGASYSCMCPHTWQHTHSPPQTTACVSSYYCMCVLILVHVCPHTSTRVPSYCQGRRSPTRTFLPFLLLRTPLSKIVPQYEMFMF